MQYVHGYHDRENIRLQDQADTLSELLHSDTIYNPGERVLEAGCGVGAQTVTLAKNSPQTQFISVDISENSVAAAREKVRNAGFENVEFQQADIFNLSFEPESFDHIFVCFVLEHLAKPIDAIESLRQRLKPGGTLTVIEGDHGSTFFHPHSEAACRAIDALVTLQRQAGGDANIGRKLYPLLRGAGFQTVSVSPRMVYVDASRPKLVEGFTRNTFTAMIEGVRTPALATSLIDEKTFDDGVRDLYRAGEDDGVFCYTFFKAVAQK